MQLRQPEAGLRDTPFDLRGGRLFGGLEATTTSRSSPPRVGSTVTSQNPVVGFRRARTIGMPKTITLPTAPSWAGTVQGE